MKTVTLRRQRFEYRHPNSPPTDVELAVTLHETERIVAVETSVDTAQLAERFDVWIEER